MTDLGVYPELQQLETERRELDRRILEAMTDRFLGKRVRVNHYHGSYTGMVTQVGWNEFSVLVLNDVTNKASQRWPLSQVAGVPAVELIGGNAHV